MPAVVGNRTTVPAASVEDSTTRPTPWTPGTYGRVRGPKYELPVAHSTSSGVIGTAVVAITLVPERADGRSSAPTTGGRPNSGIRAARIRS